MSTVDFCRNTHKKINRTVQNKEKVQWYIFLLNYIYFAENKGLTIQEKSNSNRKEDLSIFISIYLKTLKSLSVKLMKFIQWYSRESEWQLLYFISYLYIYTKKILTNYSFLFTFIPMLVCRVIRFERVVENEWYFKE